MGIPLHLQKKMAPNIYQTPIKVTLLSRHFGKGGGLEKHAFRISDAFAKKGAEVTIITTDFITNNGFHPHINFHSLSLKKWMNYRKLKEFDLYCQKWVHSHPADIVFGMDRTSSQTHIRAGNGVHATYQKRKALMEKKFHTSKIFMNPLNRAIIEIEKAAFENPDLKLLFTNSHMVKKEILEHYTTPPDKIQVIHNGVEWDEMEKHFSNWTHKKETICRSLHLNPFDYHFLFIGNGYKRKGLVPLLEALTLLPIKDFHLSVIGKDKNCEKFQAFAHKLGLKNHVSFFGARFDCSEFYQFADSLVIPSYYDPFANVTVEALAMGLFVVSSKYNGGHEILKEENGITIEGIPTKETIGSALIHAIKYPKTIYRSLEIRNSVKYLDFSHQLGTLIDSTISSGIRCTN